MGFGFDRATIAVPMGFALTGDNRSADGFCFDRRAGLTVSY